MCLWLFRATFMGVMPATVMLVPVFSFLHIKAMALIWIKIKCPETPFWESCLV